MVELEELACRAAMPGGADIGASALVSFPDLSPDGSRNVAVSKTGAAPGPAASGLRGRRLSGRSASRSSDLSPLEHPDQGLKRPIEHLGHIPRRHDMAEQRLGMSELVVSALRDRELNEVALGRHLLNRDAPGTPECGPFSVRRTTCVVRIVRSRPWDELVVSRIAGNSSQSELAAIRALWNSFQSELASIRALGNSSQGEFVTVRFVDNSSWSELAVLSLIRDSSQSELIPV